MARRAQKPLCSGSDRLLLQELASSKSLEWRLVERAKIVLKLLDGEPVKKVAALHSTGQNTVIKWRSRFVENGIQGFHDQPRSGKPAIYGEEFRDKVLKTLELKPPVGQSCWDGPAIASHLKCSRDAGWRLLRKEGVCLARQRSWCVSTDPEFVPKAADIIGLYLAPPENALVISVDEKPSIQALERTTGYVLTSSKKVVQGLKSTYKRHGTLNLFAALNVATGAVHTQTTELKRRVEFLAFMDQVLFELPDGDQKEIHVILDNYCIHKRNDEWLNAHPNVTFHFTPTSASWLNQVEIWFGILSRKALRNASFKSVKELRTAIEDFIKVYQQNAKPFVWRKREVKGSQLRDTVTNLCN